MIDCAARIQAGEVVSAHAVHLAEFAADQDPAGTIYAEGVDGAMDPGGEGGIEFSGVGV